MKHYEFVKVVRDGKTFLQRRLVGRSKIEREVLDYSNDSTTAFYKKLDSLILLNSEKSIVVDLLKNRIKTYCNLNLEVGDTPFKLLLPLVKNLEIASKELPVGHIITNNSFNKISLIFNEGELGFTKDTCAAFYREDKGGVVLSDSWFEGLDISFSKKKIGQLEEFKAVLFHEIGHSVLREMSDRLLESVEVIENYYDEETDEDYEVPVNIPLYRHKFIEFSKLCGWDYSDTPLRNLYERSYTRYFTYKDQSNLRDQRFTLITPYAETNPEEAFAEYYSTYLCNRKQIDKLLDGEKVAVEGVYRDKTFDILQHLDRFEWIRNNLFKNSRLTKSIEESTLLKSESPIQLERTEISSNKFEGCLMLELDVEGWDEFITSLIPPSILYSRDQEDSHIKGYSTLPHITIQYGIREDINQELLTELVTNFIESSPLLIYSERISIFSKDEYDVIKFEIKDITNNLLLLNNIVTSNFEFKTSYPDYTPHCTIAYVKPGGGQRYSNIKFKPFFFKVKSILYSDSLNEEREVYTKEIQKAYTYKRIYSHAPKSKLGGYYSNKRVKIDPNISYEDLLEISQEHPDEVYSRINEEKIATIKKESPTNKPKIVVTKTPKSKVKIKDIYSLLISDAEKFAKHSITKESFLSNLDSTIKTRTFGKLGEENLTKRQRDYLIQKWDEVFLRGRAQ